MRVSPFRHPRLSGYLLLPGAFRSLSRLSSALSAKASALCSFCLTCHFPSVGNAGGSFFSSFDVFLFNVYVQGSLIYHRYTRSFMYAVFKVQRYAYSWENQMRESPLSGAFAFFRMHGMDRHDRVNICSRGSHICFSYF